AFSRTALPFGPLIRVFACGAFAPSQAADSRRARSSLLRTDKLLLESRSCLSGAFSDFAGRFPARRREGEYRDQRRSPSFFTSAIFTYPPPRASRASSEL